MVSPAEMLPEYVVVIAGLSAVLLPHGWPAAVARFPGTWRGAELHAATLDVLAGTGGGLPAPLAAAAAHALAEPPAVEERVRAAARLHGILAAALHRTVTSHGALCRPPRAGSHLYPDLDPLRPALAENGVTDSVELEEELTRRLGRPVPGGHRFGDPPDALRVRLSTDMLLGASDAERLRELTAVDPLGSPPAAEALRLVEAAFGTWSGRRSAE
ncbi:hypothetical protein GCU69_06945 [Streptomyces lycii]|uniref:Pyridoxal phosphate-dependent aminotransferase n=1 Tax=Streptomyces lycii TaxID=2654337 RepID=A0ABQ7FPC4_9ACTN|nr:hypothetical protein GCU69_06945 [Streptomyces lycii]